MGKLKNKRRKEKKYRNDNPSRTISFEEIVKGIALCPFVILFITSVFNILCVPANRYILIPIVDEYGKLATATISDMYKETYYGRRAQHKVTNEVREYVFTCEGDVYYGKLKGEKCENLQIGDSLDILYIEKCPFLNKSVIEIEKYR